jgi:anti-anti-sigma factor
MESEIYAKGNYQIIRINDILNLTSEIDALEDIVKNFIEEKNTAIAIHFTDGSYLCSRSGATLIRCWELIKEHNGVLALVNVNEDIHDFLSIIDLDSLIQTYDSEEELIATDGN